METHFWRENSDTQDQQTASHLALPFHFQLELQKSSFSTVEKPEQKKNQQEKD